MTFNISDFKSAVASSGKQLARPNLFLVTMNWLSNTSLSLDKRRPTVSNETTGNKEQAAWADDLAKGISNLELKTLHRYVKSCSIPQDTITAIEGAYQGRTLKGVGVRTYDTWQMTLYLEDTHAWRRFFIEWQDKCCSSGDAISSSNNHKGTVNIVQLGATMTGKVGYKLMEAFPIEIGPVEMSWDNNDSVSEYTVTFAYNWHEVVHDAAEILKITPGTPPKTDDTADPDQTAS
jgi:hypothetical protein